MVKPPLWKFLDLSWPLHDLFPIPIFIPILCSNLYYMDPLHDFIYPLCCSSTLWIHFMISPFLYTYLCLCFIDLLYEFFYFCTYKCLHFMDPLQDFSLLHLSMPLFHRSTPWFFPVLYLPIPPFHDFHYFYPTLACTWIFLIFIPRPPVLDPLHCPTPWFSLYSGDGTMIDYNRKLIG
jgi:hypothetical protein